MLPLFILLSFLPSTVLACAATSTPSSPVLACATCTYIQNITMSGTGTDRPISQTVGTNSDGCVTLTISCTGPDGAQIVLFWTEQGADRGTSTGTTTVSRPLVCDSNGDLILTEPETGGVGVVDQVECVSAT